MQTAPEIVMSLRTIKSETEYQLAKLNGTLTKLQDEVTLQEFKYWKVIANRFPYNMAYEVHNLLIPKRIFSDAEEMNIREFKEFTHLRKTYIAENYDLMFENTPKKRSVPNLYHIHLAKCYNSRSEMRKVA